MSHVDEGALHAYLDGALDEYPAAEARRIREHVETCAVCADRLTAEREVREEAHAILALAAPQVEVPTFEELRAYVVRTSQTQGRTMSVRLRRMSWAASVVLALGTGWMLRGGDAVTISPLEREGVSAISEPVVPATPRNDAAATTTTELRAADEAPTTPPPAPAPVLDAVSDAGALGATAATGLRAEAARTPAAAPQPAFRVAQGTAEPLTDARADLNDVVSSGAGAVTGLAAGAPAPAPTPPSDRVAERIDSAARASQAERRVAVQDQVVTSAISADAAAPPRQRAANEQEEQDETPVSLVVPGLEVLDVLPVGQGTAFAGIRALQRLESGDTLELVHLPEGIDPSLLPPLRPGNSELVRQRPEGWLVMRGPVTERYLQELLQRLEGGR